MKRCTKWQRIAGTTKTHIVTRAVRIVVEGRLHHFVHGEIAGHSIQWIPSECHILGNPTCSPKDANITSPHYHLLFKRLQKKCTLSIHLILSISLRYVAVSDKWCQQLSWNMKHGATKNPPKPQKTAASTHASLLKIHWAKLPCAHIFGKSPSPSASAEDIQGICHPSPQEMWSCYVWHFVVISLHQ